MGRIKVNRLLLILLTLSILGGVTNAYSQKLIVHPDLKQTELSEETVRALFTMRLRRWSDGTPVRVFVLPDRHPLHKAFAKKILGVFPHQLRRAWDRLVFSGTGQAPREVSDETEMLDRVSKTAGAVGYVSDNTWDERVRVVPME